MLKSQPINIWNTLINKNLQHNFRIPQITPQNVYSYGINITIAQTTKNSKFITNTPLVSYSNDHQHHWIPNQITNNLSISGCDDIIKSQQNKIIQNLMISPCNQFEPKCNKLKKNQTINVQLLYTNYYVQKIDDYASVFILDVFKQINYTFQKELFYLQTFYFDRLYVQKNSNIVPQYLYPQIYKYDGFTYQGNTVINQSVIKRIPDYPWYICFTFKRGYKTHYYKLSAQKFDTVIANIFGFMGAISYVIWLSYRGYNTWRSKRLDAINREEEILPTPNILRYYKQKIFFVAYPNLLEKINKRYKNNTKKPSICMKSMNRLKCQKNKTNGFEKDQFGTFNTKPNNLQIY